MKLIQAPAIFNPIVLTFQTKEEFDSFVQVIVFARDYSTHDSEAEKAATILCDLVHVFNED